jgi:hypothetical protein
MSRKRKNGIGDKRQEELRRINKRANDKVRRIRKNYNMALDITIKRVSDFQNVREYNQYMNQMKSFLNPHNTEYQFVKSKQSGQVMRKKEYNELQRTLKRADRIRQEDVKRNRNKKYKHGGKETEMTVGEQEKLMGDVRFKEAKHKIKNQFHTEKDPMKFQEWLKDVEEEFGGNYRDKRRQSYKDRYIKGLDNIFGDEAKPLIKHIENMPLGEFMDVYYSNTVGNISYIYLPADRRAKLRNIGEGFGHA